MSVYPHHIVFASYGNDSIALIQFAAERQLENVYVVYSNTGWASEAWMERVARAEAWARDLGFTPARTASVGMANLVRQKKGWPRQGIQFCTNELKIAPAARWLEENEPLGMAICLVGVRHEESEERAAWPEWTPQSVNHGGRSLWAPLARLKTTERDALLAKTPFAALPHRSMECFPCINANRADIRLLAQDEQRVAHIESLEAEMGLTSKGKPRTMFRPYRYMGATGIREIVRWGQSERGKFELDDGTGSGAGGCDGGMCGI